MSYERYKDYRLAPDDNGCWDILNSNYEQRGPYPSKAAAKRAIDDLTAPTPTQSDETLREHYRHEIEYVLETSDETGEVRISYADGHSEIKLAKVLLLDDIMHFVDAYIAAATRTAVTEALDKVAAALPEKLGKTDDKDREWLTPTELGWNEAIDLCRAVIAAEGKSCPATLPAKEEHTL